ncbi:MAG: DMT family transporter [Alphaproteobacteria bacterium]|nr:DMT family transporter [Alphaproteobacteria bacterium]
MPSSKPLWLILAPAIFLALWSGGFTVAKLGISHAEPLSFLAVRYACVLVILAPFVAIMRPPVPRRIEDWLHLAIVGVLIQSIYFGLSYVAFKAGVSAGGVAIIVCLQPILVGLIAPRFAGEPVGMTRWLGLLLGLAGAGLVIWARSAIEAENLWGVTCAVIALIAITAGTLWEKRFGKPHHPVAANAVQYLAGLAGVLPFAMMFENFSFEWNLPFALALGYLVIGNSIIAMSLLLAMIRLGEVSRVSSLFFLVPPLSAVMAWPVLGEVMPPLGWAGFALAAAGVALASRKPKPKPKQHLT